MVEPDQRHNELGKIFYEEFGVELVFHQHADTHVDTQDRILRFLEETTPRHVNLCLDAGHIAYWDGDNLEIVKQAPERITYVHLKFVDPKVRQRVRDKKLSLAEAVPLGVMVEAPYGEPDVSSLLDALARLDREIFTILEQDLYPVAPHIPLAIQARAAGYLPACGLGPVRRCPTDPGHTAIDVGVTNGDRAKPWFADRVASESCLQRRMWGPR